MNQKSTKLSIVVLLLGCCPSAIFRLIISVVVNTVNGLSRRRFSHVGKEIFKTVVPSVTDGNASTTVSMPMFIIFISTSLSQPKPTGMGFCACSAVGAIS